MIKKITIMIIIISHFQLYSMEDPNWGKPISSSQQSTAINIAEMAEPERYLLNVLDSLLKQFDESASANDLLRTLNDALVRYQQIEDMLNFPEPTEKGQRFANRVYIHLKHGLIPTFLQQLRQLPISNQKEFNDLITYIQRKLDHYYKGHPLINLRDIAAYKQTNEKPRENLKRSQPEKEETVFKKPLAPTTKRCKVAIKKEPATEFDQKIIELKKIPLDHNLYNNLVNHITYFETYFNNNHLYNIQASPYIAALFSKLNKESSEPIKELVENAVLTVCLKLYEKKLDILAQDQINIINNISSRILPNKRKKVIIKRIEANKLNKTFKIINF